MCEPLDGNLRQIESALDIAITRRGADLLESFYARAAKPLDLDQIQLGVIDSRADAVDVLRRQPGRAFGRRPA